MFPEKNQIDRQLTLVKSAMHDCLKGTHVSSLISKNKDFFGQGKMLRSRLALAIGNSNGRNEKELIHAAAAVDLIHGASLLHDDVIDGGILRRGAPTFWKKYGINGAILFGDLLMFKALSLLVEIGRIDLLEELIAKTGDVCCSEVEQELILRGALGTWEECERVARFKTGSLFAFAAVAGADPKAPGQMDALREAGFIVGTAYQLVDDILDVSGNEEISGKTLGTDQQREKTTAITATKNAPAEPMEYIDSMLETSTAQLAAWPSLQSAWNDFLTATIQPVLSKYLSAG